MLELLVSSSLPLEAAVDLLVLTTGERELAEDRLVAAADAALGGALRRAMTDERFTGKPGQALSLHTLERLPARRLAVLGRGDAALTPRDLQALGGRASRLAKAAGAHGVALVAPGPSPTLAELEALAVGATLGLYQFARYLTDERATPAALERLTLLVPVESSTIGVSPAPGARPNAASDASSRLAAISRAVEAARDLVNE